MRCGVLCCLAVILPAVGATQPAPIAPGGTMGDTGALATARALIEQGRLTEACADLTALYEADPGDPRLRYLLAACQVLKARWLVRGIAEGPEGPYKSRAADLRELLEQCSRLMAETPDPPPSPAHAGDPATEPRGRRVDGPQTFVRGDARLTVTPSGRVDLSIAGTPFVQGSYDMLALPGSEASLWSLGEAREDFTVTAEDDGPVRAVVRREVPGVVSREVTVLLAGEMLAIRWRLRFGELQEGSAGGYREIGFFVPWATTDGMHLDAETIFSADLLDTRVRADLLQENPAPGGARWLRLRDGTRSVRIEPFGMQVQSRPEGYRMVSGGLIQSGQEPVLGVLFDWSGALDGSSYDEATGAKRPQAPDPDSDGLAVDVCAGRRHLYHPGERAQMVLRTVALQPGVESIPARFRIEDYWDRVVSAGELTLPATPGRPALHVHEVPTERTGMFRFVVDYAGADGESRSAQALYGVVPAREPAPAGWDSPFGMHLPATAHHAQVGRQIGVGWGRAHDTMPYTQWRFAEPEEGRRTFHDREYRRMVAHGIQVLGVVNAPPEWAVQKAGGRHFLEWTEEDLEMWRNYCAAVMGHYRDTIRHWEVLNEPYGSNLTEPDSEVRRRRAEGYVRALRIAWETARAVHPDLRIVGVCGPPGYYSMEWYPLVFEAGALQYMDILSAHMYPTFFRWPPRDSEDWDREQEPHLWYRQVRDVLKEHGREDLEIWNTEAGSHHVGTFYTDYRPGYSYGARGPAPLEKVQTPREAAMYTVRAAVVDLANGVKRFHYTGVGGAWYFHSIAEGDQTPMPAMVAWAVMTHLLNGAGYALEADLGPVARCHVFEVPGGAVAVLWGAGRAPSDWVAEPVWLPLSEDAVATAEELADLAAGRTMPARVGLLRACDVMGVEMPLRAEQGAGFALSEQPVWIRAPGMSAQGLADELRAVKPAG